MTCPQETEVPNFWYLSGQYRICTVCQSNEVSRTRGAQPREGPPCHICCLPVRTAGAHEGSNFSVNFFFFFHGFPFLASVSRRQKPVHSPCTPSRTSENLIHKGVSVIPSTVATGQKCKLSNVQNTALVQRWHLCENTLIAVASCSHHRSFFVFAAAKDVHYRTLQGACPRIGFSDHRAPWLQKSVGSRIGSTCASKHTLVCNGGRHRRHIPRGGKIFVFQFGPRFGNHCTLYNIKEMWSNVFFGLSMSRSGV